MCVAPFRMHCEGMTRGRRGPRSFLGARRYCDAGTAREEAVGARDLRSEYPYYTVGKLEILKLPRRLPQAGGRDFLAAKFHERTASAMA